MAPEKCRLCGSKFTGMFKIERPCPETVRDALACDIDASDLCTACCTKEAERAVIQRRADINELEHKLVPLTAEIISLCDKSILTFTTPHPNEWNAEIKGCVTGYSAIGTGVFSSVGAGWSDFLGEESQGIIRKICEGEKRAITSAKMQAVRLGANMISGLSISVTEATKASGVLIVSCAGTAILQGQLETQVTNLIEEVNMKIGSVQTMQAKIAELSSSPRIIISDSSERYHALVNE